MRDSNVKRRRCNSSLTVDEATIFLEYLRE